MTEKKIDMMSEFAILAGVPIVESMDSALADLLEQEGGSKGVIEALRDTDYRDKEAFFKMTQLLKGLAVASDKDELAKKYLSRVSDALTDAAKDVLGKDEACATPGEKKRSGGKGRGLAKGDGKGPIGVPAGDDDDGEEQDEDLLGEGKAPSDDDDTVAEEVTKIVDAIVKAGSKASQREMSRVTDKWWDRHAEDISVEMRDRWKEVFGD